MCEVILGIVSHALLSQNSSGCFWKIIEMTFSFHQDDFFAQPAYLFFPVTMRKAAAFLKIETLLKTSRNKGQRPH